MSLDFSFLAQSEAFLAQYGALLHDQVLVPVLQAVRPALVLRGWQVGDMPGESGPVERLGTSPMQRAGVSVGTSDEVHACRLEVACVFRAGHAVLQLRLFAKERLVEARILVDEKVDWRVEGADAQAVAGFFARRRQDLLARASDIASSCERFEHRITP